MKLLGKLEGKLKKMWQKSGENYSKKEFRLDRSKMTFKSFNKDHRPHPMIS